MVCMIVSQAPVILTALSHGRLLGKWQDPLFAVSEPHLEYCIQFWAPHCNVDMDIVERAQQWTMKMCWDWSISPKRRSWDSGIIQPGED